MTPLTQQLVQRTAPMMAGMNPRAEFLCVFSPKTKRWVLLTVGEFMAGHWVQLLGPPGSTLVTP